MSAALNKPINNAVMEKVKVAPNKFIYAREVRLDALATVDNEPVNTEVQLGLEKFYDTRTYLQICSITDNKLEEIHQQNILNRVFHVSHDKFYSKTPNIVSINFLGFDADPDDPDYTWSFSFRDSKRSNRTFAPEIQVIFFELPKFWRQHKNKPLRNGLVDIENWLYFYVMCRDHDTLVDFLAHSDPIFMQYETDMEEACKLSDFVTRYEQSTFNKLMDMLSSPPEEYNELVASHEAELAAKEKENAELAAAKDKEIAELAAAKDKEIAELAKRAEFYKLVAEAAAKDKEFAEKLAAKDKEFAEILEEKLAAKDKEFGEKLDQILAASNKQFAEPFAEKPATVTSRKSSDFLSPMRKFFSRKKKHD
jgi:hypothetical protein